ncbi:sugar transferase [Rhodococcus sp. X156]|uniref:sugar transferase n=1 Tax=Rhodococcus sp. X156 TaxID=2499145 RepID=UPI000FDAC7F9|nr:sugar transferase [Rhodococcus sp. X156]
MQPLYDPADPTVDVRDREDLAPEPSLLPAPAVPPLEPGDTQTNRHLRARWSGAILLLGDVLLSALALVALGRATADTATTVAVIVVTLALQRSYRRRLTLSTLDELPRLALAAAIGVFAAGVLLHPDDQPLPAARLALAVLLALVVGRVLSQALVRWLRRRGTLTSRTLVIGGGTIGAQLTRNALQHGGLGLHPVGIVDANPVPETQTLDVQLIAPGYPLAEVITSLRVETVVVAFSETNDLELLDTLRTCDRLDCELLVVPRLFELASVTGDMELVRDIPLTRVRRAPHRTVEWRFKRWFDVLFSAVALVLLAPLLAVIAVVVWLSDRSAGVLFRQTRIGLDGEEFAVLKFRTLRPVDETESATLWNVANDARLTWVGRFLRRTSLDELPQFWNVLRGDMSVVGPRPERPHFAAEFAEALRHYGARHRVPVGLTGWAAVHGLRGDTSVRERASYDNYYIENWSLWLDFKIICRTILAVVRRTGG